MSASSDRIESMTASFRAPTSAKVVGGRTSDDDGDDDDVPGWGSCERDDILKKSDMVVAAIEDFLF